MYDLAMNLMLALSVISIIVIAVQPTKTESSSSLFMGGGNISGPSKQRGLEKTLSRLTIVLLGLFFTLALILQSITI